VPKLFNISYFMIFKHSHKLLNKIRLDIFREPQKYTPENAFNKVYGTSVCAYAMTACGDITPLIPEVGIRRRVSGPSIPKP
jgi:hypothetical protein